MTLFLFLLLFFVLLCVLVLAIWIPVWRKNRRAEGGVVNHDAMMTRFVYRVPLPASEILPALTTANVQDMLRCSLEPDGRTLRMSMGHSEDVLYRFTIEPRDGFCVLRLTQVSTVFAHGLQETMLNPFVMDKLHAEPLPYAQTGQTH